MSKLEHLITVPLPNQWTDHCVVHAYHDQVSDKDHLALVIGDLNNAEGPVLVRVHSSCLTSDVFGSKRADCKQQLEAAMEMMAEENLGVFIYLDDEGRGLGLISQLKAYKLQDEGLDTVEANEALGFKPDARDHDIAPEILKDLGLKSLRLLTNNPKKVKELESAGFEVERVPLKVDVPEQTKEYLKTKQEKLGHKTP